MAVNLIKTFEQRMNSVFGAGQQGIRAPFSIRKLAKHAAREMEAQTYEIDGINTAPALYTILVSSADDVIMRSLYGKFAQEVASFIEAKAQSRAYVFCGKPLVRFMVDPALKSGKFAVFADNIDTRTLEKLRCEEDAFLSGSLGLGGAASEQLSGEVRIINPKPAAPAVAAAPAAPAPAPMSAATPGPAAVPAPVAPAPAATPTPEATRKPTPRSASAPENQASAPAANGAMPAMEPIIPITPTLDETAAGDFAPLVGRDLDESAGLNVIPQNYANYASANINMAPVSVSPQRVSAAMPAATPAAVTPGAVPYTPQSNYSPNVPLVNMRRHMTNAAAYSTQGVQAAGAAAGVAGAAGAGAMPAEPLQAQVQIPAQAAPTQRRTPAQNPYAPRATFLLINRQTGETYEGSAPSCTIGREKASSQIVLRDPNISRCHAEITYNQGAWYIRDCGSTNGTLVNDVATEACQLNDGDIITLALTNLEFRGN